MSQHGVSLPYVIVINHLMFTWIHEASYYPVQGGIDIFSVQIRKLKD